MSLDKPANEVFFRGGERFPRDKPPVALIRSEGVCASNPLVVPAPTQQAKLRPRRHFDRLEGEPSAQLLGQVRPLGHLAQRSGECLGDNDLTRNQPVLALAQALFALGSAQLPAAIFPVLRLHDHAIRIALLVMTCHHLHDRSEERDSRAPTGS